MKYFILLLILCLSSCSTTKSNPQDIELNGRLIMSVVGASSGLSIGHVLQVGDPASIQKVSSVGEGDPNNILLIQGMSDTLNELIGQNVKIRGQIEPAIV